MPPLHTVAITADGKRAFTSNIVGGSVSEFDSPGRRWCGFRRRASGIAVTPMLRCG
jgi:hypothetical protein